MLQEMRRFSLLVLSEPGGHNFFQLLLVSDHLRWLFGPFNLQILKIGLKIGSQLLQIRGRLGSGVRPLLGVRGGNCRSRLVRRGARVLNGCSGDGELVASFGAVFAGIVSCGAGRGEAGPTLLQFRLRPGFIAA